VGANDHVEKRTVELDRAIGDQWIVTRGLAPGDRLIVAGLQRVKPGMEVAVTNTTASSPTGVTVALAAH
jgi:membrane fusion protein (multidrug efflux system)